MRSSTRIDRDWSASLPRCLSAVSLILISASFSMGCRRAGTGAHDTRTDSHAAWQAERDRKLRRPDGYLSLVGLHWLDEGATTFGAGPGNEFVLDATPAPPRLGTFQLADSGALTFTAARGVDIRREGAVIESTVMETSPEPTVLEHGTISFFPIVRSGATAIRVRDSRARTLLEFDGVESFAPRKEWRVTARLERSPRSLAVPNVMGTTYEMPSPGRLVFELEGETHSLWPSENPDGSLFLVFGDETNGLETYGGGRFLDAEEPDAQGRVVLDFNRAHNPACAFTSFATCPLPLPENMLPLRVEAGERAEKR